VDTSFKRRLEGGRTDWGGGEEIRIFFRMAGFVLEMENSFYKPWGAPVLWGRRQADEREVGSFSIIFILYKIHLGGPGPARQGKKNKV